MDETETERRPLIPAPQMASLMHRAAEWGVVPSEAYVLEAMDPLAVAECRATPLNVGLMVRVSLCAVAVRAAQERGDVRAAKLAGEKLMLLLFGSVGLAAQRAGVDLDDAEMVTGGRIRTPKRRVRRGYRSVEGSKETTVMTRSLRKLRN